MYSQKLNINIHDSNKNLLKQLFGTKRLLSNLFNDLLHVLITKLCFFCHPSISNLIKNSNLIQSKASQKMSKTTKINTNELYIFIYYCEILNPYF